MYLFSTALSDTSPVGGYRVSRQNGNPGSKDPNQEYSADGVTEALITELGKVGALGIISRQSVMQYKGVAKPLPEIAGELKVDAVLEGTVLRAGDRVRITAQVVRARPEQHL